MKYNGAEDLDGVMGRLDDRQREAVLNTRGPMLVVAGAGSGKTSVLTARISLLLRRGIPPERILALTFTKKAADEMRGRVAAMAGGDAAGLRMGTFHSVFATLLRPHAALVGLPPNFTILDEEDSCRCLSRCIRDVVGRGRPPREGMTREQAARYKAEDARYKARDVKAAISMSKNALAGAEEYCRDIEARERDTALGRPLLCEIFREYAEVCRASGTVDFDDILLYTHRLLKRHEDVRADIEAHFDYIMVDEYQDTNEAQYRILRLLTRGNRNICAVGDDSQSIYAFRGARIENILSFSRDYEGCRTVKLERNYRSARNIVEAANALIAHNGRRLEKTCYSEREDGPDIMCIEADTEREEACHIADTIASAARGGAPFADFAVLYRTHAQSRAIEDALMKRRIPYAICSGTSFFERAEVKDQAAYFKLAVNPRDNESLLRVINRPARGVGDATIERLYRRARELNAPLWEMLQDAEYVASAFPARTAEGLASFRATVEECVRLADRDSAFEAAYAIVNLTGLYSGYAEAGDEDSRTRAENIRELVDSVKAFEEDTERENAGLKEENRRTHRLADYLQNIALLSGADGGGDGDRVSMMTVHCAKGLEFDSVFIAGMEENLFPLTFDKRRGISERELEEERRLFYVAVTRARRSLTLTYADSRLKFGRREQAGPSRFIDEMSE